MTNEVLAARGITLQCAASGDRLSVEKLQREAYARNRALLGVEPLPLNADYAAIFRDFEVWIKPAPVLQDGIDAALILDTDRSGDILIWSVATRPAAQSGGLGRALLACADERARQLGRSQIRLYTGQPLTHLIDWYARNGYEVERTETLPDRSIAHMLKPLA